jgi:hypothetical protein
MYLISSIFKNSCCSSLLLIFLEEIKKYMIYYRFMMETSHNKNSEHCTKLMARLSMEELKCTKPRSKGETRGQRLTGLTHECGVFGCIAAGDWPSQIDVAQVICLGKINSSIIKEIKK